MDTNISGVLFDLDGTLLDTANDLGAALNHVLKKNNMAEVSREVYRPVASDGALGLLTLGFGEKLEEYNLEALSRDFLLFYQENIAEHTCLYPGIATLIDALDDAEIPWGIVTNKPEYLSKLLLPHFSKLNRCKVMVGGDTLAKRKPDPAPILYACEQLNIAPNKAIYVGDALRDIEAGNAANLSTVIALWGYILNKELCKEWQADSLALTPEEIIKFTL